MAKVTDHTLLDQGTEFDYDPTTTTLTLSEAGDLVEADGVDLDSIFSACEDEKRSGSTKNRYRFPFFFVTGELGNLLEIRGGWTFTGHSFLRDGGVRHRSGFASDSTVTQEYACIVGLGSLASGTNQVYVLKDTDTAPTNLGRTGLPNELVKIYDSGRDDDRGGLEIFLREWGNTFVYYDLFAEQSLTSLLPVNYNIPLSTSVETNGTGTDGAMQSTAFIDANTPYTGMGPSGTGSDLFETLAGEGFTAWANSTVYGANAVVSDGGRWYITTAGGTSSGTGVGDDVGVTWVSYTGERDVDGTYYAYKYIHDANSGTVNQYYEYHQRSLLKTSDIDASASVSQRGDTCPPKVSWANGKLRTATGHFIDNIAAAQAHLVEQTDIGGTVRAEVFTPTLTVNIVDSSGVAANAPTGARIRINDETNANELYNNTPGAVSSVAVSYTSSGSATIKVEYNAVSGSSSRSLHKETTVTMTDSASQSINITFEDDTIYVANNYDGSADPHCSINANKIDININVGGGANVEKPWQEVYNWYCCYQNTEAGIRDSSFLITANTQVDYTFDNTLEVANTDAGTHLSMTGAYVLDQDGNYSGWMDQTGGGTVGYIAPSIVAFNSGGAGFTSADRTLLTNANSSASTAASKSSEVHVRLDLDATKPNTYKNDNSEISNDDFTLTKTDNGSTFTVQRS